MKLNKKTMSKGKSKDSDPKSNEKISKGKHEKFHKKRDKIKGLFSRSHSTSSTLSSPTKSIEYSSSLSTSRSNVSIKSTSASIINGTPHTPSKTVPIEIANLKVSKSCVVPNIQKHTFSHSVSTMPSPTNLKKRNTISTSTPSSARLSSAAVARGRQQSTSPRLSNQNIYESVYIPGGSSYNPRIVSKTSSNSDIGSIYSSIISQHSLSGGASFSLGDDHTKESTLNLPYPVQNPNDYLPVELQSPDQSLFGTYQYPDKNSDYFNKTLGNGASAQVKVVALKNQKSSLFALKKFTQLDNAKEKPSKFYERVAKEFILSMPLNHINVVKTKGLFKLPENKGWGIILELCQEEDLFSIIQSYARNKMSIPIAERNCYFKQILNGIGYLHKLGIVHLDIKPENILLNKGEVKLTDFGCSDFGWIDRDESKGINKKKGFLGSPPYLAPEVIQIKDINDKSKVIGYDPFKVDTWAIAITYYCLTKFGNPFAEASVRDKKYAAYRQGFDSHISSHPDFRTEKRLSSPPVSKFSTIFDDEFSTLMYHMLDPDPKYRFSVLRILQLPVIKRIKLCVEEVDLDTCSKFPKLSPIPSIEDTQKNQEQNGSKNQINSTPVARSMLDDAFADPHTPIDTPHHRPCNSISENDENNKDKDNCDASSIAPSVNSSMLFTIEDESVPTPITSDTINKSRNGSMAVSSSVSKSHGKESLIALLGNKTPPSSSLNLNENSNSHSAEKTLKPIISSSMLDDLENNTPIRTGSISTPKRSSSNIFSNCNNNDKSSKSYLKVRSLVADEPISPRSSYISLPYSNSITTSNVLGKKPSFSSINSNSYDEFHDAVSFDSPQSNIESSSSSSSINNNIDFSNNDRSNNQVSVSKSSLLTQQLQNSSGTIISTGNAKHHHGVYNSERNN